MDPVGIARLHDRVGAFLSVLRPDGHPHRQPTASSGSGCDRRVRTERAVRLPVVADGFEITAPPFAADSRIASQRWAMRRPTSGGPGLTSVPALTFRNC